jgi:hypothetical protein
MRVRAPPSSKPIPPGPPTFVYRLENTAPIELLDLTASLMAVGEQFKRFVREQGSDLAEEDIRLFIKEVRSGSVIAELVSLGQQFNLLTPDTAWVVQFAEYLASMYQFFKGHDPLEDQVPLDKKDYDQLSQIIEPAAKDSGAQLNIVASTGAMVHVNLSIGSTEANAIQNRIRRTMDRIPETLSGIHYDQVLYWYQVRDDSADKPGDRAVIPKIYPKPVKVRFADEAVKIEMIDRPENPFRLYYIIDVDVTEINGKPVLYKILHVKDTIDRDSP